MIRLRPQPLTPEGFTPFGEVIEAAATEAVAANQARFARYLNLAKIDIDDSASKTSVSVMVCEQPVALPFTLNILERHSRGSQAFLPMGDFEFYVVVAPAAAEPDPESLRAFVTNGRQGINMRRGIWHNPMIGTAAGQGFFVLDCGHSDNCDEVSPAENVILEAPK